MSEEFARTNQDDLHFNSDSKREMSQTLRYAAQQSDYATTGNRRHRKNLALCFQANRIMNLHILDTHTVNHFERRRVP